MSPEPPRSRWWNALRPPPPAERLTKADIAKRRRQRRLIWSSLGLFALLGCGWYVYGYITSAPQRAHAEFDRGMLKMGPGSYEEAIKLFTHAISIWPEYADAYLYRGVAKHNLNQPDAASGDLNKATSLNPNLTRAYDERGRIFLDKGDTQHALKEFAASIRIRPTTYAYYQRGLAYEALGDYKKALEDFNNAIAELREAPYAYRARAEAEEALGDTEAAKADRDTAEEIESR